MINMRFWNVRGMNSHTKQFEINKMLNQNNVGLFGLLETRIQSRNQQSNVFTFAGQWSVITNYNLHSGGRIWLIWDPMHFELVNFRSYSQCIHAKVKERHKMHSFWITVV